MTVIAALAVALGAAIGAPLRWSVERRLVGRLPWGTFAVNIVGSFIVGAVIGTCAALTSSGRMPLSPQLVLFINAGFCGALTTFGGVAAQVLHLAGPGQRRIGVGLAYATGTVVVAIAASALGWQLANTVI